MQAHLSHVRRPPAPEWYKKGNSEGQEPVRPPSRAEGEDTTMPPQRLRRNTSAPHSWVRKTLRPLRPAELDTRCTSVLGGPPAYLLPSMRAPPIHTAGNPHTARVAAVNATDAKRRVAPAQKSTLYTQAS